MDLRGRLAGPQHAVAHRQGQRVHDVQRFRACVIAGHKPWHGRQQDREGANPQRIEDSLLHSATSLFTTLGVMKISNSERLSCCERDLNSQPRIGMSPSNGIFL